MTRRVLWWLGSFVPTPSEMRVAMLAGGITFVAACALSPLLRLMVGQ